MMKFKTFTLFLFVFISYSSFAQDSISDKRLEQLKRLKSTNENSNNSSTTSESLNFSKSIRDLFRKEILFDVNKFSGTTSAVYELNISDDGLIENINLITSSNDLFWDQAVRDAIVRVQRIPIDKNNKFKVIRLHFSPK